MRSRTKTTWRSASYGIAVLLASACAASSARPELHVHVDGVARERVRIFRDGVQRPNEAADDAGTLRLTPGYYGRVLVEVEGPTDAAHVADRAETGQLVTFDPPAPVWIFPFDLAVEAVRKASATATPPRVRLRLDPPKAPEAGQLDDASIRRSVEAVRASALRR